MCSQLIINNVDLELLELQRIEAREYVEGLRYDTDAIEGILDMLDYWSDERDRDQNQN